MIEFDDSTTRRLPVYLVLDTSGSMAGSNIEAVNQGVQMLLNELKNDPMALETAWVSCITFDSTAREILPLTELGQVSIPKVSASGSTNLGAALRLLLDRIAKDVRPNTAEQKGDWKPLVFLMSDGQPTDTDWPAAAAELREHAERRTANIIALAMGQDIEPPTLKQITPVVLLMQNVTPDHIRSFFKWVSQSVRVTSRSAAAPQTSQDGAAVDLPPLPSGIQVVL